MGALTRDARAEESVAENVPAVMRGPNPDTRVITYTNTPVSLTVNNMYRTKNQSFSCVSATISDSFPQITPGSCS